eukprot:GHVT01099787.1.p1 GENE.GHVT01099787.1~~GHVT01099787.1.p1  ORF type:complete len:192 (+),score=5.59 GHVT01099787.1:60-635(+)
MAQISATRSRCWLANGCDLAAGFISLMLAFGCGSSTITGFVINGDRSYVWGWAAWNLFCATVLKSALLPLPAGHMSWANPKIGEFMPLWMKAYMAVLWTVVCTALMIFLGSPVSKWDVCVGFGVYFSSIGIISISHLLPLATLVGHLCEAGLSDDAETSQLVENIHTASKQNRYLTGGQSDGSFSDDDQDR